MTTKNDGGPAFPVTLFEGQTLGDGSANGMTLRDWLAGKAMSAILRNMSDADRRVADRSGDPPAHIANAAYAVANAMIRAREA